MLIKIDANGAVAIPPGQYLEKQVEAAVEKAPAAFLGMDLLLIGRQVRTDRGIVDLLGLDRDGNVVIIELKRHDSPREIVSQSISYRSHFRKAVTSDNLTRIAQSYFGKVSDDGNLLREKLKARFGVAPKDLNKKQIVVLLAERFPDGVLDDLEEVPDHVCIEFSYFRSEHGEDFFSVRRLSEPDLAHAPTATSAKAMAEFDTFFRKVVDEVKRSLPTAMATFRNTQVHRRRDQWIRFHWGGTDVHIGLWAKKGQAQNEFSIYFTNWKRDPRVADVLRREKSAIRKALGIGADDGYDPEDKTPIDKQVSQDEAAQTVVAFISTLKPLLGDRL